MYPQRIERRGKILLKAYEGEILLRLIRRNGDDLRFLGDIRKALDGFCKRHRRRNKSQSNGAALRPLSV